MSNDVTIALSFGSSAGVRNATDAGAGAPSPLSLDALGAPGGTAGSGADRASVQAPEPVPLDRLPAQLQSESSQEESAATAPSPLPLDELGAPGGTSGPGADQSPSQAPEPVPLDRLPAQPPPESSREESGASAPSPTEAPSSPGNDEAPSPKPLDELQPPSSPVEGDSK
jgi:hypothetical protein